MTQDLENSLEQIRRDVLTGDRRLARCETKNSYSFGISFGLNSWYRYVYYTALYEFTYIYIQFGRGQ